MSEGETEHGAFVWGTNLVIEDVQNSIRRFMRAFTLEGSSEALYHTLIKQVSHVTNPLGTQVSQHVS
jgi:disulfide bond formation protein DsbB